MTAEAIAQALQGRRTGPGRWMARCPAHDDRTPSLSITDRKGTVLVHCFAGCRQAEVIEALRARGLWPERKTEWLPHEQYRAARNRQDSYRQAERWKQALLLALEHARRDAWRDFLAGEATGDTAAQSAALTKLLELAAEHRRIRNLNGAELLMAYGEAIARDPKGVAAVLNYALDDDQNARDVTALIVAMLALAQAQQAQAERRVA
jgi:hypothetical protein